MKAKLIKTEVNYLLKNEEGVIIASTSLKKEGLALSLKNCQAIELGYDLDELASDIDSEKVRWSTEESLEHFGYMIGIKDGFQKALSILGDKKFSEKDVKLAINIAWDDDNLSTIDIIQELQQTEWEVEIYMECDGIETGLCDESCTCNVFLKLDADGCIVLKRK